MKDGSSLVVTPSSIPCSIACEPDADLSFEGSKDVLEDLDNEPTKKKRISDSYEEESVDSETEFMDMPLSLSLFFAKFIPSSFVIFTLYICLCNPFTAVSLHFV